MLFLLSMLGTGYAQVETNYYQEGETSHNPWQSERREMNIRRMPSFDLAQLQKEDADNDETRGLFRFGKGFDVSYSLADGQWEDVDGGRLWTMTFLSEGALSLNFVFNDLYLPEGAELYIENQDKTVLFGPVTGDALTENGFYLTDLIPGEQATIYLYEPTECRNQSSLTIERVVHGYRAYVNSLGPNTRNVISYGVACYPAYEQESDAVAMVLSPSGDGICSGALVMATNYSFKGYFLTTFDLIDTDGNGVLSNEEKEASENSMFKFRYKKKTCEGTAMETSYTYNHATFRAAWNVTMSALMEIGGNISQNKKLTWLGWDRNGTVPTSCACIHHQSLTDMRLCKDDYNYIFPWSGNNCWSVHFSEGGVALGSHGAPLLDQNKRVVAHEYDQSFNGNYSGTPTGYFGKFSESWLGNYTSSTSLSFWLDPLGSGQQTMNSSRTMTIKGPNKIISSSSYYVENLPSGMTVVWTISDSYYHANCLQQNTPSANRCTVTRDPSHSLTNALLKAYIRKNGSTVNIIQKIISTGDGFDGTYYNGQSTVQVDLPSPLYVLPGTLVTITSSNLIGATASQNGGNTTPTSWIFNGTSGILKVGMPSSSGMAVVVKVTTSGGNIYNLPITTTNDTGNLMSVSPIGNYIEVSMSFPDGLSSEAGSARQVWTLESYNATTGDKVFQTKVEESSYTIDTTDWKPGVYVVRGIVGGKVFSEKVVVK